MRDVKNEILEFWFEESDPKQWFQVNEDYDEKIKGKFEDSYDLAVQGIFDSWREGADGTLALIILLDQFPRNMFRNKPRAFATDSLALEFAKQAIERNFDDLLPVIQRRFLYLPFEHSEDLADQDKSVSLFEKIKKEDPLGYEYALRHQAVIEEFGRFPHRNKILGRDNTKEEQEYLKRVGNTPF